MQTGTKPSVSSCHRTYTPQESDTLRAEGVVIQSAIQLHSTILALFQMGNSMGQGGMMAMMTACVLFGLLLFIALVELVILEFIWIKLGLRRLRNEGRPMPAISSRAA